jgi:hypothetical protein
LSVALEEDWVVVEAIVAVGEEVAPRRGVGAAEVADLNQIGEIGWGWSRSEGFVVGVGGE